MCGRLVMHYEHALDTSASSAFGVCSDCNAFHTSAELVLGADSQAIMGFTPEVMRPTEGGCA